MNSNHLLENKNHLIDRLDLTTTQKEEIKAFFAKHPTYESKIDWNDKNLSYEDFKPILALDGKSKTQAKHKGIEGLVEGVDYKFIEEGTAINLGKYRIYQPLTYLGSCVLASNKVPPVKGNGARWCISYQKTSLYWDDYTKQGVEFLFVCTKDTKYAVVLYPNADEATEIYTFGDAKLIFYGALLNIPLIRSKIFANSSEELKKAREYVDYLLERHYIVDNGNGTCDSIRKGGIQAWRLVVDGRLYIRFRNYEGTLDLSNLNLTSLHGCPERVTGDFYCYRNQLTSLEGAPKYVGGSFDCSSNGITSLKDGPEEVEASYTCNNNDLVNLVGAPRKIKGSFFSKENKLVTLIGGPEEVGNRFDCRWNKLASLEGAPKKVLDFCCSNNRLTSLEGAPREVERFDCINNGLTSLEGAPEVVKKEFLCAESLIDEAKRRYPKAYIDSVTF